MAKASKGTGANIMGTCLHILLAKNDDMNGPYKMIRAMFELIFCSITAILDSMEINAIVSSLNDNTCYANVKVSA